MQESKRPIFGYKGGPLLNPFRNVSNNSERPANFRWLLLSVGRTTF